LNFKQSRLDLAGSFLAAGWLALQTEQQWSVLAFRCFRFQLFSLFPQSVLHSLWSVVCGLVSPSSHGPLLVYILPQPGPAQRKGRATLLSSFCFPLSSVLVRPLAFPHAVPSSLPFTHHVSRPMSQHCLTHVPFTYLSESHATQQPCPYCEPTCPSIG
jgi:hypothetical protein